MNTMLVVAFILYVYGVGAIELDQTCNVKLSDHGDIEVLKQALKSAENLIYLDFTINETTTMDSDYTGKIFQPLEWVRVRGTRGEALLWLRPDFETVSLATLSFGVERLKIDLSDSPLNCFRSQSVSTVSKFIRDLIFYDLNWKSGSTLGNGWKETERLCNMRLRSKNGFTEQFYECCYVDKAGDIKCSELKRDTYVDILLWCIVLINIFAIMYAPRLVPERLYKDKTSFMEYEHTLKTKTSIKIRTTKIVPAKTSQNVIKFSALRDMPEFRDIVSSISDDAGYEITFDKLYLNVQVDKLITENAAPVGIITNLFNNFILCKISDNRMVKACCASSIFGTCISGRSISWYKILRQLSIGLFMFSLLGIPWVIRVWVFYSFEAEHQESLLLAAEQRNLAISFPGSLTLLLTPTHVVFIVCYVLILLNGILFVSLRKVATERFKYTLRKCFRDMNSNTSAKIFGWGFVVLLKPFEKFGCFGFIVAPFYLLVCIPIVLCVLLVYCVPTINITLRLFFNLVTLFIPRKANYTKVRNNFKSWLKDILELDILFENESADSPLTGESYGHKILQFIVVLMSILSMYAVIFIFLECFAFFIEVFVYILIGLILNANFLMKNVSLAFILVLYAKDCFGGVNKKYLLFNKAIMSAIESKLRDDLLNSWQSGDVQSKNVVFQVESEIPVSNFPEDANDKDSVKLIVNDGALEWHIERLLLFLNDKDVPYISENFFFDASRMNCTGSPGALSENLLNATLRFMIIIVFLAFVSIVVIAFGDLYNVSSANQTLATLAGGFLPFVFTKFLFKSVDLTVDTSNLYFMACFNKVIHEFSQSWPVADIISTHDSMAGDDNGETSITKEDVFTDEDGFGLTTLKRLKDTSGETFDLIIDMRSRKKNPV